jgi:pentatricopeptide repeat protein
MSWSKRINEVTYPTKKIIVSYSKNRQIENALSLLDLASSTDVVIPNAIA